MTAVLYLAGSIGTIVCFKAIFKINCFIDSHVCNSSESLQFCFHYLERLRFFFLCINLHVSDISTIGLSLWLYNDCKLSVLSISQLLEKTHKAVQSYQYDRCVHIACNHLNVYTYRKLQKDKLSWYCPFCYKKEMQFCSLRNEHLQERIREKVIISPNNKVIANAAIKNELMSNSSAKQTISYSHWMSLIMLSRI